MQDLPAIRKATVEDADLLLSAMRIIGDHLGTPERITASAEDLRRHGFGPSPAFTALIAEITGEFAGMCLFFRSFSTWRGQPGAYIQDLVVPEKFRGRGVAEALLHRTARHVRAEGGAYLRLSVDAANAGAQRFYERIGMVLQPQERIHAIYGEAFDLLAGLEESGV